MKEKTFIEKIVSNPVVQTIVIYVSGGWIVLEITEYLIAHFGLNENTRNILLVILVSFLPIAIFISWYIYRKQRNTKKDIISESNKGELERPATGMKKFNYFLKKPRIYFPALIIIFALLVTFFVRLNHQAKVRWAREVVITEINNLLDQSTYDNVLAAFLLTKEISNYLKDDPEYRELMQRSSYKASVYTKPSGAKIYIKNYKDFKNDWELLIRRNPDFIDFYENKCLSGGCWVSILASQPQLAKHCEWKKLNDYHWDVLLREHPDFMKYYKLNRL